MDYLDRLAEEQAAKDEAILAREEVGRKTPEKPKNTCVDEFALVGLYRSEAGWCRLLADSEKRQIKLEKLTNEDQVQENVDPC